MSRHTINRQVESGTTRQEQTEFFRRSRLNLRSEEKRKDETKRKTKEKRERDENKRYKIAYNFYLAIFTNASLSRE